MQKKIFGKIEKFVDTILKKILNNGSLAKKMLKASKEALKDQVRQAKSIIAEKGSDLTESDLPRDIPTVDVLEVIVPIEVANSSTLTELPANPDLAGAICTDLVCGPFEVPVEHVKVVGKWPRPPKLLRAVFRVRPNNPDAEEGEGTVVSLSGKI